LNPTGNGAEAPADVQKNSVSFINSEVTSESYYATIDGTCWLARRSARSLASSSEKPSLWGYYELLEAVNNPKHEAHQQMLDWLGEPFDPGRFDLQAVNAALRRVKL
jgi:hypothetical protein